VISIILSIFLLTYTYIEARSNYHRGSILVLSYLVLAAGFYFAPSTSPEDPGFGILGNAVQTYSRVFETGLSLPQVVWRKMVGS
jgi:Ca2+:H+ antiporter